MDAKPTDGPVIGLALGSGSARGWAHVGVLRELAERGIQPSVIAGASVGALVAAASASGQLDALQSWISTLTRADVWRLLDASFGGGGVIRGNRLMQAISESIDDCDIEALPMRFGAVAADLNTGEEIWLREGSMLAAVRASSGMPGLFTPIWYQGRWMIDGGVVNPVPVTLCRAMGADYVIAVNLNVPVHKRWRAQHSVAVEPEPAPEAPESNGLRERWNDLMAGLVDTFRPSRSKDPGLFDVMAGSIHIMQDHIARSRMAGDPPNLTVSPDLSHFQLMDFHRAEEAIALGRAAVRMVEPALERLRL